MKVGEDEVGFSWVGEHIVLLELEGGEEGIVPYSVDDFE